jgi:alkaline phosphatase
MKRAIFLLILIATASPSIQAKARNVILFIGDAGGIPTLNAASWYKYGHPQKLFIQSMPNIALMDTSAADYLVTDSAAGMSAIVTGEKTNNGVISESASAKPGKQDGKTLETILEYAEQRGLATGVLSNMDVTDATPAACYAHVNDRSESGKIFSQVFTPRFGDGIDLIIGAGRDSILAATEKMGLKTESAMREKGYAFYGSLQDITNKDKRVIVLLNTEDFPVEMAVHRAIQILSRNPKGFFLMVEWDTHTDHLRPGLNHVIELDNVIRKTAETANKGTLIIFAADHSFDLRLLRGKVGESLLPETESGDESTQMKRSNIAVGGGHTGEQVLVAAQGPGAKRVHGFIVNTDLFHIMMAAYGWEKPRTK